MKKRILLYYRLRWKRTLLYYCYGLPRQPTYTLLVSSSVVLLWKRIEFNIFPCCKEDCISKPQSRRWHKAFRESWEEIVDEPRSGRPITARNDKNVSWVRKVLRCNRRLNIQQIADTLSMSTSVVHGIVTEDVQCAKSARSLCRKFWQKTRKNFEFRDVKNC